MGRIGVRCWFGFRECYPRIFPDDLPIVTFDPEENLVDVLQRCVELADPAQFDDLSAKHEASMTCQGLEEMIGVAKELD